MKDMPAHPNRGDFAHGPFVALAILIAAIPLFFLNLGNDHASPVTQLTTFWHAAFFALLAWTLVRVPALARLGFARQALIVLIVVLLLGGTIELIQPCFGRTASWRDLGINMLGGAAGLLFFAPKRRFLPGMLLRSGHLVVGCGAVVFVCCLPLATFWDMRLASRQFPVLSDFETRFEAWRWTSGTVDRATARHGRSSLRVPLDSAQQYPGTTLWRSHGDWRGHAALALCMHNPGPGPLSITISIRDQEHQRRGGHYHDRFNQVFELRQGWNDLSIPLEDIEQAPAERTMALDQLTYLVVFAVNLPEPRTIHLDHVRLVP